MKQYRFEGDKFCSVFTHIFGVDVTIETRNKKGIGRKMKNLKWFKQGKIILCFLVVVVCTGIISYVLTRKSTLEEVGLVSTNYLTVYEHPVKVDNFVNKYSFFLDDEKAEYLVQLCSDFNVDSDLVVAILMQENPTLKVDAVSGPNANGTADLGLFQLNDCCLFQKDGFLDLFWPKDFPEFEATNWKHNSYIAIRLIEDLTKTFGENAYENIAAAYNCGSGRVFLRQIPVSTSTVYVPSVMNNLAVIKRS